MKNKFILGEIRRQISIELHLPLIEVQNLLVLMTELIPEFVTIFPADDLVKSETMLVNLITPFPQLIGKLKELIRSGAAAAAAAALVV